jgi:hypothetical protein
VREKNGRDKEKECLWEYLIIFSVRFSHSEDNTKEAEEIDVEFETAIDHNQHL